MQRVIRYFKNDLALFREYYQNGQEQIDNTNFYALRRTSLITTLLLAGALILMFSTDQRWELEAPCALVLMLHLFLCVALHARTKALRERPSLIRILSLFFLLSMLTLAAYLSTYGMEDAPGVYFAPFAIVLTMIFILPAWQSYTALTLTTIYFAWMSATVKDTFTFQIDLTLAATTLLLGMIGITELYSVRLKEYRLRSELMRRSSMDALTGLMNKTTVETCARSYLEHYANKQSSALMVIDLDQFKQINDQLGHQTGDEALEAFGEALLRLFRSQDIVGRVGGDEFMVLMKNIEDPEMVIHRAEAICEAARETKLKNLNCALSCSIGIAMCPYHGTDYDTLFSTADEQLYMMKRNKGKSACQAIA
jgi:diguanylate cyclase (GGDEF)-like protein